MLCTAGHETTSTGKYRLPCGCAAETATSEALAAAGITHRRAAVWTARLTPVWLADRLSRNPRVVAWAQREVGATTASASLPRDLVPERRDGDTVLNEHHRLIVRQFDEGAREQR